MEKEIIFAKISKIISWTSWILLGCMLIFTIEVSFVFSIVGTMLIMQELGYDWRNLIVFMSIQYTMVKAIIGGFLWALFFYTLSIIARQNRIKREIKQAETIQMIKNNVQKDLRLQRRKHGHS